MALALIHAYALGVIAVPEGCFDFSIWTTGVAFMFLGNGGRTETDRRNQK